MTDDPLLGHNESHYSKFRNDRAVPFKCMGISPPCR